MFWTFIILLPHAPSKLDDTSSEIFCWTMGPSRTMLFLIQTNRCPRTMRVRPPFSVQGIVPLSACDWYYEEASLGLEQITRRISTPGGLELYKSLSPTLRYPHRSALVSYPTPASTTCLTLLCSKLLLLSPSITLSLVLTTSGSKTLRETLKLRAKMVSPSRPMLGCAATVSKSGLY